MVFLCVLCQHLNHGVGLIPLQEKSWASAITTFHLIFSKKASSVKVHPKIVYDIKWEYNVKKRKNWDKSCTIC